jgi:hypothetical protein
MAARATSTRARSGDALPGIFFSGRWAHGKQRTGRTEAAVPSLTPRRAVKGRRFVASRMSMLTAWTKHEKSVRKCAIILRCTVICGAAGLNGPLQAPDGSHCGAIVVRSCYPPTLACVGIAVRVSAHNRHFACTSVLSRSHPERLCIHRHGHISGAPRQLPSAPSLNVRPSLVPIV